MIQKQKLYFAQIISLLNMRIICTLNYPFYK